ncbi:hypothetical protein PCE1_001462 [Barthelona sp. PCE]
MCLISQTTKILKRLISPTSSTRPRVSMDIKSWIKFILKRGDLPKPCLIVAISYLKRIQQTYPEFYLDMGNFHLLFLTACIVASNFVEDRCYDIKSWSYISQYFTHHAVKTAHLEMLNLLDWNAYIDEASYNALVQE